MDRVFSKIDRVVANSSWIQKFHSAEVAFLPEGKYDHSPAILRVFPSNVFGKKPFRFYKIWITSPRFQMIVKEQWKIQNHGCTMYKVMTKLKNIKRELKIPNKEGFIDIQAQDTKAFPNYILAQKEMHEDPMNILKRDAEKNAGDEYRSIHENYVSFLRQKTKTNWVVEGDSNTEIFHRSIKLRNNTNKIHCICDMNGNWKCDPNGVNNFLRILCGIVGYYR